MILLPTADTPAVGILHYFRSYFLAKKRKKHVAFWVEVQYNYSAQ